MKVVLLAPANSIHTVQWAKYLSKEGIEMHVISQHPKSEDMPSHIPIHLLPFNGLVGYFINVPKVKNILKELKPDIVHAHYASGYGTTARLVNFHPYILSVWGSDVYDFPYKSKLHHWLIKKNLYSADRLTSTSHCMMEQTLKISPNLKPFDVIPFGVDMQKFTLLNNVKTQNEIVIGTVKTLSEKYGIDLLIQAFAILKEKLTALHPEIASKLKLRIVGGGKQRSELECLAQNLNLNNSVTFTGQVSHQQVPLELDKLNIYVALSRFESFGVAVIEAGAMRLPCVVADVGGLPEVVCNNETGIIVPRENPEAAAEALEKLVLDVQLQNSMGNAAYDFVKNHFSWGYCIEKMYQVYKQVLGK